MLLLLILQAGHLVQQDPSQHPADVTCFATAKRLEPQLTFNQVCEKKTQDAQFAQDFERARAAVEAEADGALLPTWVPAAESGMQKVYGHEIYQKAAAFMEVEMVTTFKKTPKQLNLTPYKIDHAAPGQGPDLFLISLVGLPADLLLCCRKIKIYHCSQAVLYDQWLRRQLRSLKS